MPLASLPPRILPSIAVGAVMALLGTAAPAHAAGETIVIDTTGGTERQSFTHGGPVIDPAATALRIDPAVPAEGDSVVCTLEGYERTVASETFAASEWDAAEPVVLGIPDGEVADDLSSLVCTSSGATGSFEIVWYLDSETETGGTDLVEQDGASLYFYTSVRTFAPGPVRAIRPGATVLLRGSWEYAEYPSAALTSSDPRFGSIDLPVSYEESGDFGLRVEIPADLPPGFTAAPATLSASAASSSGPFGDYVDITEWSGPVVFAAPSRTSLALERRVGVSRERITATAAVTSGGAAATGGTVEFVLNSRVIGSARVGADGRASFLLPRLPRGKHFVVATYRSADGTASSSSAPSSLRILI